MAVPGLTNIATGRELEPKFFLVHGIHTWGWSDDNWTDHYVQILNGTFGSGSAEEYPYFSTAISSWAALDAHAVRLARRIQRCQCKPIVVAHSNGARIVLRMLREHNVHVEELHLIGAACVADFEENGLHELLREGKVGRVVVHWSPADDVLKNWAKASQYAAGAAKGAGQVFLGLWYHLAKPFFPAGFGQLGYLGPINWDPQLKIQGRLVSLRYPGFKHSGYFSPEHFEEVIMAVTSDARHTVGIDHNDFARRAQHFATNLAAEHEAR